MSFTESFVRVKFQFTHPGRGATCRTLPLPLRQCRFNSRTPGGVRHLLDLGDHTVIAVSIHAPREGCDSAR